jgi:hypothetical protein
VVAWIAADDAPVREEVADFRALVAIAVGLLSALFIGVLAVQVQVGLRPLRALSEALCRVRSVVTRIGLRSSDCRTRSCRWPDTSTSCWRTTNKRWRARATPPPTSRMR